VRSSVSVRCEVLERTLEHLVAPGAEPPSVGRISMSGTMPTRCVSLPSGLYAEPGEERTAARDAATVMSGIAGGAGEHRLAPHEPTGARGVRRRERHERTGVRIEEPRELYMVPRG